MSDNRIFYDGDIYHICNKSISNYHIFRNNALADHFKTTLTYYNTTTKQAPLSKALKKEFTIPHIMNRHKNSIVYVLGFCIMPDHYHLLMKVNHATFVSQYINNVQNSYSHFYNKISERHGPLWQNRFRAINIEDNSTLLHVLRYIHLNPTTANLVSLPEKWSYSSYVDYISDSNFLILNKEISINSIKYLRTFTENQIDYQRTIKGIRRKLLE